jgi:transcriptional regulator with XRE-family HTH domain
VQIGELILSYRKEHKLSQRQFAKKCGDISNGYISMLENNLNPATNKGITPTVDKLKLIAHAMDMSLDDLFKATDDTLVSLKMDGNSSKEAQKPTNDDELLELRESMRRNPEMRILFSATKGAKKEHIKAAAAMLEALKASNEGME